MIVREGAKLLTNILNDHHVIATVNMEEMYKVDQAGSWRSSGADTGGGY